MQGAASFASLNRSRTRLAPTPTNISTKSEPEIEKNATPASPATAREQRLAGAGRPVEEHALGDAGAERLEAPRVGEELLDLMQLLNRLVDAGHVPETDLRHIRREPARLVLAEAHHLAEPARTAAHPPHHQNPDRRNQQDRYKRLEDRD